MDDPSEIAHSDTTDAGRAARILAEEILAGEIAAGSRLYIRELVARTGFGATPLREGVTRLVARGLVKIVDHRGFYVTPIDDADIRDMYRLLTVLEQAALHRSLANGDARWVASVEDALRAFIGFSSARRERPTDAMRRFSYLHKELHMAFVSACGSPRMLACLDVLYDQELRVCHVRAPRDGRLAALLAVHDRARHAELTTRVLERGFERAAAALIEDRGLTAKFLGLCSLQLD
jgi:DNA-binding GntR family transcriptional regulator